MKTKEQKSLCSCSGIGPHVTALGRRKCAANEWINTMQNHFKETGAKEVKNGMKCAPIIYQPQTTQPWGTTEVGRPSGLALERRCCYLISQVVC